jgi:cellulose synthase/poly-beta-1,6-N-acetylglucosamine synthase-like glycosyltransferase
MISLAIPNYNRVGMTVESFSQVINNDKIDEIIILDDFSDIDIYNKLWDIIITLNTDKVKLYRNAENIGAFWNKYKNVKRCNSEWIILLDCDNIINNDYIDKVYKLIKEPDVLYCPETLYKLNKKDINWTYKDFNTLTISKENIKKYIDDGIFGTWMNTGNFFFNRNTYTEVVEHSVIDARLSMLDSFYLNYLWLSGGKKMKIVPGLYYIHRVHKDSYYLKNRKLFPIIHKEIRAKIKTL